MSNAPDSWQEASIRDVLADEFPGAWGDGPEDGHGNALALRSTNIDDEGNIEYRTGAERVLSNSKLESKRLQTGDLILEGSGGGRGKPVGRVAYFEQPDDNRTYVCSNFFRTLRPSSEIDERFLFWRLLHYYRQSEIWRYQQQTTSIINLKHQDYLSATFKWPPLPEQRRIADVLDTVDAAIQETDAVVEKQEQVKTGLLQDLLTRGLDADGRLRDPEREPEAFRETEMGRFPEGWQIFRLGEVAESAIDGPFGSKLKTSHYVDQPGVRVVRLQNIGNGVFDDADKAYVSREHARSLKRHKVVSGDLLVASLGDDTHPVGRACQYPDGHPPAINKADCFRVRVSPSLAVPRFVMHLLNCSYTREDIGGLVQGVTRDRINLTNLKRVRLPIPPIEEQERIVERIGRETAHIVAEKAYGGKLRHLKKGLMQDLLTGQVRVPEAEARVDEVIA